MPRIIVTTDSSEPADILLDEHIHSVHLSTGHAASQLVERLAWAISDAEEVEVEERAISARPARFERRGSRRQPPAYTATRETTNV
jgi:hypothetical protein